MAFLQGSQNRWTINFKALIALLLNKSIESSGFFSDNMKRQNMLCSAHLEATSCPRAEPSITLNKKKTYFWYISNGASVEQSKYFRQRNFFPWFKYKSYCQWCLYRRLRQTRWVRIFYRQFALFEWWSSWTRLPSYVVFISQVVRFARCCSSVLSFLSKNLQITSILVTQSYRYHKLRKTFGKIVRSYSGFLSKFGEISFQEFVSEGFSHHVFYGDLVYKISRVKCEFCLVVLGNSLTPIGR